MSDPSKIEEMLEDCLSAAGCSNVRFSAWEIDFLDSIDNQFKANGTLSKKQSDRLEQIWDKI